MPQLTLARSKPRMRRPRRSIRFSLSEPSEQHLRLLRLFYEKQAQRSVSTSLIVRRALEGLLDHVTHIKGQQAVRDEILVLFKHIQ